MDAEYKEKFDRMLKMTEESHEYIRQIRRTQKTAQMWKAIYWVVIIMFVLGGYYYIKPYLTKVTNLYTTFSGATSGANLNLPEVKQLQGLVDQFKNKQ